MKTSWKTSVADLCSRELRLGPIRTLRVIEQIEVLIATDQVTELAVTGVLVDVGMKDPNAGAAARSIRSTISHARA
jgi:hypothetical protein